MGTSGKMKESQSSSGSGKNPKASNATLSTSKNMKFQLSQNLTKFDVEVKFRETIPTVKSVSSSEI